jgi:hypothetical protein
MQVPELTISLVPQKIIEMASRGIRQDDNLAERYWPVLRGFEQFGLKETLDQYIVQYEDALGDFAACIQCNGKCGCSAYVENGLPVYYALDYRGMNFYNSGKPVFTLYMCPGVMERKEQIKRLLVQQN